MGTVIKADGVISNPSVDKILAGSVISSDSCNRSDTGEIVGKHTLADIGGIASVWTGAASMFTYNGSSITAIASSIGSTVYLTTNKPLKNCAISFEIVSLGSSFNIDLRKRDIDSLLYRLQLTKTARLAARNTDGTLITLGNPVFNAGDKISLIVIKSRVMLYQNGNKIIDIVDSGSEAAARLNYGYFAIAKGSTTSATEFTSIKNIILHSFD